MQSKIIPFPKHPTQYHTLYYFREYFHIFLNIVFAWTCMFVLVIEEPTSFTLGVGFGVWLVGVVWLVDYMVRMGVKRKQERLDQFVKKA